ncbi:hypothetical protein ID866_5893 [Astraeus odoratus]|nr:hypothetical protein ID866_5893 [Astraeus odoratus]
MVNDQAKNAGPAAQEHPYTHPMAAPYPSPFAGYPVFIAQAPDANHADGQNGGPGPPLMIPIAAPPGMLYPYPPPGQPFPQYQQPQPPANGQRPKRKQVKMAANIATLPKCTNCASACKRCDEARPCERCVKYGIQETCVDGVRKERQKGIKRGPYKRKNKNSNTEASFTATNGEQEWQANGTSSSNPPPGPAPAPAPAVPHFPTPEGFYPLFFPPPGFVPPGHEGGAPPEGTPNGTSQPPAVVSYYPISPPGYFPYAPPPGVYASPPAAGQVSAIDPADATRNSNQPADTETRRKEDPPATGKKRSRTGKNVEPKTKKVKAKTAVNNESSNSNPGGAVGGSDQAAQPGAHSPVEGDDA